MPTSLFLHCARTQLLIFEPAERLGSDDKGGAAALKRCNFFNGFDFAALEQREYAAPFVPALDSSTDTRNCREEADIQLPQTDQEASQQYAGQDLYDQFPGFSRIDDAAGA